MKWRRSRQVQSRQTPIYPEILLESGTIGDIERLKKFGEKYTQFHWHYYFCLVMQRGKILPEIRKSLLGAVTKDFKFSNWQRVIPYKYSNMPFSVAGSLKDIGGRFNIGDISPEFASFPAYYVAAHKDTSLQEHFCQQIDESNKNNALFFALANPTSLTNISLSGHLCSIIDLREPKKLQPFIDLIKDFTVPDFIKETAKEIKEPITLIQDIPGLLLALEFPNWRLWPMQFDVPSAGQIFGQLVAAAGIEGIVYRSKFTGKECIAIFPQNFEEMNESSIKLDDEPPIEAKIRHLNGQMWKLHQKELEGK